MKIFEEDFRVLTLRQPWAGLIASGIKTIETRTWSTKYRGPLLITAGKQVDELAIESLDFDMLASVELATGVCLCIVDLVDVRPMGPGDANKAFCPAHPDLFSWVLENVRPIRAVAFKGQQGLFKTDLKPIIL